MLVRLVVRICRISVLPSRVHASLLFVAPAPPETMLPPALSHATMPGDEAPARQTSSVQPSTPLVNSLWLTITAGGRAVASACAAGEKFGPRSCANAA